MWQAGLGLERLAHCVEFAPPQGVEKVALQDDPLSLPLGQPLVRQMLGAGIERVPDLRPEPAHRKRHAGTFDQTVIEPGRARRGDLALQVEIGAVGQDKRRARIVRTAEAAHLDDAAGPGCLVEGIQTAEADMMRAPIRPVDHGIGGAGLLVVQAGRDQPPDDRVPWPTRRRWRSRRSRGPAPARRRRGASS